ncbi:MAG: cupin domain-containing protein [Rhizobacter sp.]|nr:cupin domain-containing protein [Ferruginibacter sp.]
MDQFVSLNTLPLKEIFKGGFVSSIQTENLTISYSHLKAGTEIPIHQHPEEAIDILLSGLLEMKIGNSTDTLSGGMISIVPSNIPHKAKAVVDCKVLTIFFPQRNL